MSDFMHLPVPGKKAHRYIRKADINDFLLTYGAEEESLNINMKDGWRIIIHAHSGVTMADLDAILLEILKDDA
jgi:hypothetical protein